MTMTKDSIYEFINAPTQVMKQHFVEDFTGDSLDSFVWGKIVPDSGTAVMSDLVDGGLVITNPAASGNAICIAFNANATNNVSPMAVRQFSHSGSAFIVVEKFDTFSNYTNGDGAWSGFAADANLSAGGANTCMVGVKGNNTDYRLQTTNGSGSQTRTASGVTADTNWHTYKAETTGSLASLTIDGIFIMTTTSTLPAAKMGINISAVGDSSNVAETYIRYIEAWNT